MYIIKDKKTGEFIMKQYRDDGTGIPDLHMTTSANDAKIYKSRTEAISLVKRIQIVPGWDSRLEVIRVWGRTPN